MKRYDPMYVVAIVAIVLGFYVLFQSEDYFGASVGFLTVLAGTVVAVNRDRR